MFLRFQQKRIKRGAIDSGHRKIEHEQVVSAAERQLESVLRTGRGIDLAAEQPTQRFTHEAQNVHIVIDHQHALNAFEHIAFRQRDWHIQSRIGLRSTNATVRSILLRVKNATEFAELANLLRERLAVIGDHKLRKNNFSEQLARLQAVSDKIVELQARLPRDIDPQLRHFLERCSYDKALAMLSGASFQLAS